MLSYSTFSEPTLGLRRPRFRTAIANEAHTCRRHARRKPSAGINGFRSGTAPVDITVIDACLTAEKTGSFGGTCVGLVAAPCIKATEAANDDVAKWKACMARELAIWTQKTNEMLNKVQAGGFADVIKAVKDSQETFAASRDRFCAVFDKVEPELLPPARDREPLVDPDQARRCGQRALRPHPCCVRPRYAKGKLSGNENDGAVTTTSPDVQSGWCLYR